MLRTKAHLVLNGGAFASAVLEGPCHLLRSGSTARSLSTTLQQAEASTSLPASQHGQAGSSQSNSPDWDWAFVVGAKAGRKPAIKRMQRHQWYFCNPNYDPSKPLPKRILPPHAPSSAAHVDDWQLFNASLGGQLNSKGRKDFVRFLKLRDVDWRTAFERGLAQYVKDFKKEQRVAAERLRQQAWQEYREKLFAEALQPQQLQSK